MPSKKSEKGDKDIGIGDVVKKLISIGVGAAFMTEDAVRNIVSELPIPKDIVNGLLQNAKSAKQDFLKIIGEELKGHFNKLDPKTMVKEVLENYDLDIEAKIKFKRKDSSEKMDS